MSTPQFAEINFSYSDAESELTYAPELLRDAFVDLEGITGMVQEPAKFLVHGPKGAGKTALASRLILEAQVVPTRFCELDNLENFEFDLLRKAGGKKTRAIGGAVATWKAILLLRVYAILRRDEGLTTTNSLFSSFCTKLEEYGLLASSDLTTVVQRVSRPGFFGQVFKAVSEAFSPFSGGESSVHRAVKDSAALFEALQSIVERISPTDCTYLLFLDGMDYPVTRGRENADALADLVSATKSINSLLEELGVAAKVVLLFRDEILDIVPDPNLAKRVTDHGIALDWTTDNPDPSVSSLVRVIAKRADLVGFDKGPREIWKDWFPRKISRKETPKFILDNTRYIPRDLISVFRYIQKLGVEPPFSKDVVITALRNYSEWFNDELSNSLVGLVAEDVRTGVSGLLAKLGRQFTFSEFSDLVTTNYPDADPVDVARQLVATNWVGHFWYSKRAKRARKGAIRYAFRYRRRKTAFDPDLEMVVHNGLWKSLNLI